MELKILVGIPASGKSTWAKNFVSKNDKWCIVSRDDIRYAWQNRGMLDTKLEGLITNQIENQIETLINSGYSVIYDATNVKQEYISRIAKIVQYTANVTFQIFDVPVDIAIARDLLRERLVGEEVIRKMYANYLVLLDSFNFEHIPPIKKKYITPVFDSEKKDCYIFDIDGTLAHTSGKRSPYNMSMVHLDDVDERVAAVLRKLHRFSDIIIVSGRDESARGATVHWLEKHKIPYQKLLMRANNDSRKDSIIKEEIFWNEIEPHYNVLAVFDDRDQVVKMWRNLGIKTFQCDYGNF